MTSTMMMDRTTVGVQGVSGVPTTTVPGVPPVTSNWLMVPRCTYRIEKCKDGLKIVCVCDDPTARSMMQNLCSALAGGLCTVSCTLNGVTVCTCNLTMGLCRSEITPEGCCITCVSGDKACCDMIQACCDCLSCLCNAGCTCCILLSGTPISCGYSESYSKTTATKR